MTPGVWHDCLLSPQLLAVAMDWIRRRAVETADGSGLTLSMPAVPNYWCSKGSAPYWSNPPVLIFDIQVLWRSVLSARAPECQKLKLTG